MESQKIGNESSRWAYASLEDVQANMKSTGYPMNKVHFIKGLVENTIPKFDITQLSLLRLDTDWYESTAVEMRHLYSRLVSAGVLILDDYGHFNGAKKAVDDYFAEQRIHVLLNRIDYAGRLIIKP